MFEKLAELSQTQEAGGTVSLRDKLNEWRRHERHKGLAICFDKRGQYAGVKPYTRDREVFYIQAAGANGYSICALQYLTNANSTVSKIGRALEYLAEEISEGSRLQSCLRRASAYYPCDSIAADIQSFQEGFSRDDRVFIFIAILEGDRIHPLYLNNEVEKAAIEELFSRYSKKGKISEKDRVCSICGVQKQTVYGNYSFLKCYNLDKRGMITGGFHYPQAVANFPVCKDCIAAVTHGYNFAGENLDFWMCGHNYVLLPRVRDPDIREYVLETILSVAKQPTLKEDRLKHITASEKELLLELAETTKGKDTITLSMIFYEGRQAEWRITAEINEVLPSRIKKIYDAKQEIENDGVLRLSDRERDSGYYFTLATLRPFAGDSGKQSEKQFLAWVDAIFRGGRLDPKVAITKLVGTILSDMRKGDSNYRFTVRDAWAVYQFFDKLNLIETTKGGAMADYLNDSPYGKFIEQYPGFFNTPEKMVAFLTGCYVNTVLYVQWEHLGNDPFFKKVRGLKLDKKRLQDFYPEARNKLHQYDALGLVAKSLDPLLANAWVEAGDKWRITDDEATFAFTVGLALAGEIGKTGKPSEEDE